ncbi:MAG TPA: GAF domain-containing protein, partial [Anaerolineaceae bacterium]
ASAIQSATPFQAVVISYCDPDTQMLTRIVGTGVSQELWTDLQEHTQPWSGVQKLLKPEFSVGSVYYIPKDKAPAIPEELHVVSLQPALENQTEGSWQPEDILLIPIYASSNNPLGLISVDSPSDNRRPDRPTLEALEMFAAQSSILLESYRRAGQLERQVEELSREKNRLEQSAMDAQGNLPMMLHKELEQSIALRGYSQRIERIRASLEIAAVVNRQENEGAVLRTLANELLTRFAMHVALIAERTSAGISLLETIGNFPPGTNPEALFGQRNPLRHMLQQYQPGSPESAMLLAATLDATSEWSNNTLVSALEGRSMIGLSLEMSDQRVGGVLVIGQRALQPFQDEDRRVLAQLSRQVSVGLQNLRLFNETRRRLKEVNLVLDFSRKLGGLTPDKILAALVEGVAQVLPHANAGWVGMWEEKERAIIPQAAVGYASSADILAIRYELPAGAGVSGDHQKVLPLRVFQTGRAERADEINFAAQYQLSADDLLHYRKATGGRLPVSVMCVPLQVGESV